MEQKHITLRQFAERFLRGDFDRRFTPVQVEAGWYDWWCKNTSLWYKTQVMGKKVLQLLDSPRIDPDRMYVFFKNNMPVVGPTYDQFSICDMQTGNVLFCLQNLRKGSHGCEKAHWELYAAPEFKVPAVNGTWKECKEYFYK